MKVYIIKWKYSISYSAIRSILHSIDIPVPKSPAAMEEILNSDEGRVMPEPADGLSWDFGDDTRPNFFSQEKET